MMLLTEKLKCITKGSSKSKSEEQHEARNSRSGIGNIKAVVVEKELITKGYADIIKGSALGRVGDLSE